ncbi:MAG: hypothetical protein Hyperionvirus14_11 [Hyperionvirus sp.]|uniref:Ankyrin repeat protein n=1 Tax=Hyperionvirus sp. TaxID=2487770 RepID=A0A3G5AA01_9VIRU|nr:MAG: hypothetical protein Hyperionvirus14_11 [Hyperionvirus sp.]
MAKTNEKVKLIMLDLIKRMVMNDIRSVAALCQLLDDFSPSFAEYFRVCYDNAFRVAVENGFVNVMVMLRRFGYIPATFYHEYHNAIRVAALKNQKEVVRYLLPIVMSTRDYDKLLVACCGVSSVYEARIDRSEAEDIARVELIDIVYNFAKEFMYRNPLYLHHCTFQCLNAATIQGLVHVTRYLIEKIYLNPDYVPPGKSDNIFQKPLEYACLNNSTEIVRLILQVAEKVDVEPGLQTAIKNNDVALFDELTSYLKKPIVLIAPVFINEHINGPKNFMRCLHIQNRGGCLNLLQGFELYLFEQRILSLEDNLKLIFPNVLLRIIINYC